MSSSTSLQVGLGASQADIDVQGEIDFDFFEDNDTNAPLQDAPHLDISDREITPKKDLHLSLEETHLNTIAPSPIASDLSASLNKPVITISCDHDTGAVQKTTIEAVIPSPFDYKESKCGKASPVNIKNKKISSPRLKSKIFEDNGDVSDDSSLSSMSPSESDLSSVSDEFDNNADETDSMTDVSPICSPFQCHTPSSKSKVRASASPMTSTSMGSEDKTPKKDGVKFTDDVKGESYNKCDTVDLHELLKAVKRLEIEQNSKALCEDKCSRISMLSCNGCKKNLSFSNDEVKRIDNENQRLLKKIIAQQSRPKSKPSTASSAMPSSAINRQRQQRQIELENLALLKRLEATKPSRNISRSHLLRDYDRRSSAVSSRASSRSSHSCCNVSQPSSCRSSAQCSGRSSTFSLKSSSATSSRSLISGTSLNKHKRSHLLTIAHD